MPLWFVPGLSEGKMYACVFVWVCVGGGGAAEAQRLLLLVWSQLLSLHTAVGGH